MQAGNTCSSSPSAITVKHFELREEWAICDSVTSKSRQETSRAKGHSINEDTKSKWSSWPAHAVCDVPLPLPLCVCLFRPNLRGMARAGEKPSVNKDTLER